MTERVFDSGEPSQRSGDDTVTRRLRKAVEVDDSAEKNSHVRTSLQRLVEKTELE